MRGEESMTRKTSTLIFCITAMAIMLWVMPAVSYAQGGIFSKAAKISEKIDRVTSPGRAAAVAKSAKSSAKEVGRTASLSARSVAAEARAAAQQVGAAAAESARSVVG